MSAATASRRRCDEASFTLSTRRAREGGIHPGAVVVDEGIAIVCLNDRRVDGIHLAPFEQGEIGADLFRHACLMGLEGLVSWKHTGEPVKLDPFFKGSSHRNTA